MVKSPFASDFHLRGTRASWGVKKSEKNLMSVIFPPATLGPEMAAPILWAPGIFLVLSAGKPPRHKNPPSRGGVVSFEKGGGSANFIFIGVGIFSKRCR